MSVLAERQSPVVTATDHNDQEHEAKHHQKIQSVTRPETEKSHPPAETQPYPWIPTK